MWCLNVLYVLLLIDIIFQNCSHVWTMIPVNIYSRDESFLVFKRSQGFSEPKITFLEMGCGSNWFENIALAKVMFYPHSISSRVSKKIYKKVYMAHFVLQHLFLPTFQDFFKCHSYASYRPLRLTYIDMICYPTVM